MLHHDATGLHAPAFHLLWDEVPNAVAAHLHAVPRTYALEVVAQRVLLLPEGEELREFIRQTCGWGGYQGISGRVLKNNEQRAIERGFQEATRVLEHGQDASHLEEALRAVNSIHSLGRPSFASKHLRLLRPDAAGVLDRIVAKGLAVPLTRRSFAHYSVACQAVAAHLNARGVVHPVAGRVWVAGDVDLAVFATLRGWYVPGGRAHPLAA